MRKLIKQIKTAIDRLLHRHCGTSKCCGNCTERSVKTASDTAYEETKIKLYEKTDR